ncbi:MAG TPA: hypothetical protein PLL69_04590 [Gemmatimonadales bacterium]|nr:hypothetical protein [Gemmatimonadales bacterium]
MTLRVLASLGLAVIATGCAAVPDAPPVPSLAEIETNAPQHSAPGEQLGTIVVRVLDSRGQPVPGWPVTWSGDGNVEPLQPRTDQLGRAEATWTLPRYPEASYGELVGPSGVHRATASVEGIESLHFTTTARALTMEQIDVEGSYACGIRAGQLWCWGAYPFGSSFQGRQARRIELPAGVRAIDLRALVYSLCILDSEGTVRCRGIGSGVQFEPVDGLPPLQSIDGSDRAGLDDGTFCGLARDTGQAWCWAMDADETGITVHPPFQPATQQFTAVRAGYRFGCGLNASGEVWCWGSNQRGQLGDGTTTDRDTPALVAGLPPAASISLSRDAVCAATSGGDVWCWGAAGPIVPATPVPTRVTVPGIRGNVVVLGENNEGHVIDAGRHSWWTGSEELWGFTITQHTLIADVAESGQACVLTATGEVYCSWILTIGGGDTSLYASDLIAVKEPVQ